MISVLTLTYKRHHILEEAIYSFLQQDFEDCEMVIINDCPDVAYVFNHPKIRVINHPKQFKTLGKKYEFGFTQCKGDYIFWLDDDDLLTPNALSLINRMIVENSGYDIYRCARAYYFCNNRYESLMSNVNNGNCYRKEYFTNIEFPNTSIGHDTDLVFNRGAKICEKDYGQYAMIYRWGSGTYNVSSFGANVDDLEILRQKANGYISDSECGVITLMPHFKNDYWNR